MNNASFSTLRLLGFGHAAFALALLLLGTMGFVVGDILAVFEPLPRVVPGRPILAYLCALIALACGAGLCWPRAASGAARVLAIYLLVWMLLFRVPVIALAPRTELSWESCGEILVVFTASWILNLRLIRSKGGRPGVMQGEQALHVARLLYALALVTFGLSHFVYLKDTADLVPGWLPWREFWAYLFGATYLSAALGIASGLKSRLAALLITVQMGMFTLLVWLPILASGPRDALQLSEFVLSCLLTASAWVVADSYAGAEMLPRADS